MGIHHNNSTDITPFPNMAELDLEHYMSTLSVEDPPPSPTLTTSISLSLVSTTDSSEAENSSSSSIEHPDAAVNGSDLENDVPEYTEREELWSECVYEDYYEAADGGEAEDTTGLPDYSFLPHSNEHPPSYYDAPPSFPSLAAMDRGIQFNDSIYEPSFVTPNFYNFGIRNRSHNVHGFFPSPPPPYVPLPETQDFGLNFNTPGMYRGMSLQPGQLVGFNSPLTPPPPYDTLPFSTSFPPITEHVPFGAKNGQFMSMPSFPSQGSSYLPHPPRPHPCFGLPMGNNHSLLFPPTSSPSQPIVFLVPIAAFQDAVSSISQAHQSSSGQRVHHGIFPPADGYERYREGTTFHSNSTPPPLTPLATSTPTARPGLNPHSATFYPKGLGIRNLCLKRDGKCCNDNCTQLPSVQYRLEPALSESTNIESFLREENFPYVSNFLDFKVIASYKPSPTNFAYYVPPRVDDNDYFGGQIRIWNESMMSCFNYFVPHIWILQGLPDFNKQREHGWSHFTITCKLRFCCRRCLRAWTSMRGKIHFAFRLDTRILRGLIVMKIFGQVCNHEKCDDHNFQTPACYPEEIERVLWKLSEYVGFISYRVPLSCQFYNEPDKAIRVGHPRSPHRPGLCQACQQGLCSRV